MAGKGANDDSSLKRLKLKKKKKTFNCIPTVFLATLKF